LPAEFVEIDQVGDLGGYDGYVVGSGIYLDQLAEGGAPFR
jgi:hypothetical protein